MTTQNAYDNVATLRAFCERKYDPAVTVYVDDRLAMTGVFMSAAIEWYDPFSNYTIWEARPCWQR
jgi:hypothetical protein